MLKTKRDFYSDGYYKGLAKEARFSEVASIFKNVRGDRLLDVGCGDGDITLMLKNAMHAREAYGVEISLEAVNDACGKGILARQLDIDSENLPFEANYFDGAYLGEIIEHVFDPDHLLSETWRVLKKGGVCVLTTPNLAGWPSRLALLFGYQPYPMAASPSHESVGKLLITSEQGQWGHIRVMTLRTLRELVTLNRFKIVVVSGSTGTVKGLSGYAARVISVVDRLMSTVPSLAVRVVLILEKV
jgi:methionine biosynthesis protein MetW